ncbi:MAG: hypothetical protein E7Z96_05840 [Actinomycetaceae bacterium]|nr:hypothetical protein [Actinomycetaceae bacterium]
MTLETIANAGVLSEPPQDDPSSDQGPAFATQVATATPDSTHRDRIDRVEARSTTIKPDL